jgi:5,10-methylenetetrahydromethanopterin reductase
MDAGALIIPVMPARELVDTIVAAEAAGLDYCLVADETLMTDAYVALAAAAHETTEIRLGPVTNGYTRHPATTAAAIATLDDLSGGRAVAVLVAGGSLALAPVGMTRDSPVSVLAETVEVMRRLWSGEPVTWTGAHFRLEDARLGPGRREIPVWIAARGPRLLRQAGRTADGVVLEVRADLAAAIDLVDQGANGTDRRPRRVYLDRLAYRPETATPSEVFVHVLADSPTRQLHALGLDDETIDAFRRAYETRGPTAASAYVTEEVIRRHRIMGSPGECSEILAGLARQLDLDVFLCYVNRPGLAANVERMREVEAIVENAVSLAEKGGDVDGGRDRDRAVEGST